MGAGASRPASRSARPRRRGAAARACAAGLLAALPAAAPAAPDAGLALWHGLPSPGGVWIAHPEARGARAVVVRLADGRRTRARLLRLDAQPAGAGFLLSSAAARALELEAGQPARVRILPAEAAGNGSDPSDAPGPATGAEGEAGAQPAPGAAAEPATGAPGGDAAAPPSRPPASAAAPQASPRPPARPAPT